MHDSFEGSYCLLHMYNAVLHCQHNAVLAVQLFEETLTKAFPMCSDHLVSVVALLAIVRMQYEW